MNLKVISGGQNGVDQAALEAAKIFSLSTGGWMPKGWLTLDGPRPEFKDLYNMVEHDSPAYPPRTRYNVRDSDFTLRIADYPNSSGEVCTHKAITDLQRPSFLVTKIEDIQQVQIVLNVLKSAKVYTLNVAGNSEETAPGIQKRAYIFLCRLFELWIQQEYHTQPQSPLGML